jgi:hypothetical protein
MKVKCIETDPYFLVKLHFTTGEIYEVLNQSTSETYSLDNDNGSLCYCGANHFEVVKELPVLVRCTSNDLTKELEVGRIYEVVRNDGEMCVVQTKYGKHMAGKYHFEKVNIIGKVKCYHNVGPFTQPYLTQGNDYYLTSENGGGFCTIIDDRGIECTYLRERFFKDQSAEKKTNGKLANVAIESKQMFLDVWADEGMKEVIEGVEGVTGLQLHNRTNYSVFTDPRYDREIIAVRIAEAIAKKQGTSLQGYLKIEK